jgi:predicted AlkP superfamily pyrophosphatase or phosphodiesterase
MTTGSRLVIVFVVDGLRPDSITAEDTPTLHRLRAEGVDFAASHAVFPTVTRVNAAAIATGTQPGTNGLVGNQMYVPAVDERRAFDTGNHRHFLTLDRASGGRLLEAPTLAERLHARGLRLAGVSSGSTGSAFLLNPRAPAGVGALVNGYLDPGRTVAYPEGISEAILSRLGPAPPRAPGPGRLDASVSWTQRVLREVILPDLAPAVVINWLTEPDHSQHHVGVGSPAAREALRHDDREIAGVLAALDGLGLAGSASVLVISDHGFSSNTAGVDVTAALIAAGHKAAGDSTDVVLASSGQAVALHIEGRDPERVARLARFVQSQDWGGVVFTREPVAGAFPLELIHVAHPDRGPDLLFTFPWSSRRNAFGVRGTDLANVSAGAAPYASDHGSMSPWNVRNAFLAWGAGVKAGVTVGVPAGNVDVAPTVLALLGLDGEDALEGRVLREALQGGPDPEQVSVETRVHTVAAGGYRAALQVSEAEGRRYVDKSWRIS